MAYTTIDDPSAHFQVALYTGNGGSNAITNDGNSDLQPDLTWLKERSSTSSHQIIDSSRGDEALYSDTDDAEGDVNYFTENSDGFTLGTNNGINENTQTYVAWQWKMNGGTTTSGGGDDSITTSTYQANTTAKQSIVTYTGEASAKTVAHGLGVKPNVIIVKCRTQRDWHVYFDGGQVSDPETDYLRLNTTLALTDNDTSWNDTAPTTSVFTIGSGSGADANGNTDTFVAYCFANVQGYSKFGSYEGNGNDDGPFVYTGFKPAWLMYKRTNDVANWRILDHKREAFNVMGNEIYADLGNAAADDDQIDFLSNGFKLRNGSSVGQNGSGSTYVYMAFAEEPFVSSEGVPCTAR